MHRIAEYTAVMFIVLCTVAKFLFIFFLHYFLESYDLDNLAGDSRQVESIGRVLRREYFPVR